MVILYIRNILMKRMVIKMKNKNVLLNMEVECLKNELYDLLENEPWAKHAILNVSTKLDNLILKFYIQNK